MKKILFLIVLVFCSCFLLAEIIYVPDDYRTIQAAIDYSSAGDEIIVRDDDEPYVEDLTIGIGKYITLRSEHNNPEGCTIMPFSDPNAVLVVNAHEEGTVTIKGFTFAYSGTSQYTNGLYIGYLVNITDCLIRDMGASGIHIGLCEDNDINVTNCTIVSNDDYGISCSYLAGDQLTVLNTIVYNNDDGQIQWTNNLVSYSCIEDGYTGTGNIDDDPLFNDVGNDDYTLKWNETDKSPCIDTGDPGSPLDPDDTRADMGALYHPHEVKTYEFPDDDPPINGWKWLCFDVLDITMTGDNNTVDPFLVPIQDDLDYAECDVIGVPGPNIIYIEYDEVTGWSEPDWEIISPQGYKFRTENACSFDISGFRCDRYTTINVLADQENGNWIGYFLSRSQHVYDAFDGYLDNIYKIQAQHWTIEAQNHEWPDVNFTLSPGDMVIVWCDNDIREFCWVDQEQREPYIIEVPQSFSYEEEFDYIPIYMQLDPEDLPTEIGALIDGECKGATVVQDTSAQICAYILECQGGSLEFEFYYGGRSQNKVIKEYYVYDPETMQTEKTSIKLGDKKDSYYVSFKDEPASKPEPVKLEASNYPNPFNPVTTISYSLPNESEISLTIYNIKGQKVKELIKGTQPAGSYNVTWDGKDESSKDVTSGIYFYKLRTQNNEVTRKMLLLK